jgi:hypothetical protein
MRNLPAEPGHESSGGGGSAFADFISRLRPYPPPPGFQMALLYAAGGALALLVAGIFAAALPTDLEGNGFHAIGASEIEPILRFFAAPAGVFIFLGFLGLGMTALVGMRRRIGEMAGAILALLTMIGMAAFLWMAAGWAVWGLVTGANALLWLLVLSAIPIAGVLVLRGEFVGAIVTLVIAFVFASVLSQAASDPEPSPQQAGVSQEAPAPSPIEAEEAPPPEASPAEPPPVSPAVGRQQEEEAERQRQREQKQAALTQRRIALEARMTAEYAGWREVPYFPPCDRVTRRAELEDLRGEFAGMKQYLREAARNGGTGVFRRVARDLESVTRERERALADPAGFFNRYGTCPSGAGAMAFLW